MLVPVMNIGPMGMRVGQGRVLVFMVVPAGRIGFMAMTVMRIFMGMVMLMLHQFMMMGVGMTVPEQQYQRRHQNTGGHHLQKADHLSQKRHRQHYPKTGSA